MIGSAPAGVDPNLVLFPNKANLKYGPLEKTQNILDVRPVAAIEVSPEWQVITRTIVPVISQPN